jgi:hypothetical protein
MRYTSVNISEYEHDEFDDVSLSNSDTLFIRDTIRRYIAR